MGVERLQNSRRFSNVQQPKLNAKANMQWICGVRWWHACPHFLMQCLCGLVLNTDLCAVFMQPCHATPELTQDCGMLESWYCTYSFLLLQKHESKHYFSTINSWHSEYEINLFLTGTWETEASLVSIVSSRTAKAIQTNPVSKNKNKN